MLRVWCKPRRPVKTLEGDERVSLHLTKRATEISLWRFSGLKASTSIQISSFILPKKKPIYCAPLTSVESVSLWSWTPPRIRQQSRFVGATSAPKTGYLNYALPLLVFGMGQAQYPFSFSLHPIFNLPTFHLLNQANPESCSWKCQAGVLDQELEKHISKSIYRNQVVGLLALMFVSSHFF